MVFIPKTLDVISSYSLEEQLYIYKKTKELKEAFDNHDKKTLDLFKSNDKNIGIYEVFLEDSTRTKESFRNAIEFHGITSKIFDTQSSSFNKKESYADTFNMLTGYHNHIFIVRSKLEGVCTWLDYNGEIYAKRHNCQKPLFINAGDGKHEHPTQEMLDQFTLLEANNRDTSSIHIALIGDLLHGRTIHSKIDGLRIYKKVKIDLIAPTILSLPTHYIEKMKQYGYEICTYISLDDYLKQNNIASYRYFTRLQLERMGESILQQEQELRKAISCTIEHIKTIEHKNIKFYHPLPRNKINPEIPIFLDNTKYNGREEQSRNGMFVRIILLGIVIGVPYLIENFSEKDSQKEKKDISRIHEEKIQNKIIKKYSTGVNPIENGIVIDHIAKGNTIQEIKKQLSKIVSVLGLYTKGGERISYSTDGSAKGIIFRPDFFLEGIDIKKLSALAPGCTLNEIRNNTITKKLRLSMPPKIYDFDELSCKNLDCISHKNHQEHVIAEFKRNNNNIFECKYCNFEHQYQEIRDH